MSAPRVVDVSKIERVRFLVQKQEVRKNCTKHFPRGIVLYTYRGIQDSASSLFQILSIKFVPTHRYKKYN